MDKKTYYITTPIYYPSDRLHIGHSYTTVVADALARYKRMCGYDVLFLTGTDEHGQKIADKAAEVGKAPKQYVDDIVVTIKELWKLMNISYDRYIRTTDDYHVLAVQRIFKRLYDKGDIYKGVYKGHYCKPCEAFWTESQLVDGKCPDCGRDVQEAQEEAYFFKLASYADKLLELYKKEPEFIAPETRKNEMISFINMGLDDLCVSRTSVKWGVPVTFDDKHTVYVWVDALSNYITALGYENSEYSDYTRYWPAQLHLVAKEILRFHTIIWPALLMALDEPLPKQVFGHGWLLLDGGKMSKSKGNIVDPVLLCESYGVDAVRYYLLREIPFGNDANFSNEALITRINADLANDLGNLVSRTTAMVERYFGGTLPAAREPEALDDDLSDMCLALLQKVDAHIEKLNIPQAVAEIFKLVQRANKYIDETLPWALAKDDANKPRLASVLYNLCEVLRFVAITLKPFMPDTADKIAAQLNLKQPDLTFAALTAYGQLPIEAKIEKGDVLFPRIDLAKELERLESALAAKTAATDDKIAPAVSAAQNAAANAQPQATQNAGQPAAHGEEPGWADEITIDHFMSCRLIAAKITACEKVEKADKLLKLTVFDGERERTIVSGIAAWYTAQQLVGRTIAIVANLKPAKLRGIISEGMIMASEKGDAVKVVFLADDVEPGARIR